MRISKSDLKMLIENFLLEQEQDSEKKKEFQFGSDIAVSLDYGSVIFKPIAGGVAVVRKNVYGEDEKPLELTSKDVKDNNDRKKNFVADVAGYLQAIARDVDVETRNKILKKLNGLIDMTPALNRKAMVDYNAKVEDDKRKNSNSKLA